MKVFYRSYRLKKDLPELSSGAELKWNCWKEHYSDIGDWVGLNQPKEKVIFTKEIIDSKPEWFEPIGKAGEYYPKFPTQKDFFDESDGHCYLGETRHNNMCRICQLLNKLESDKELKKAVYEVYKKLYDSRFI